MFLSPPPPPPSSPLPPRHPLLLPSVEYAYEFAYVACASACVASENQALMENLSRLVKVLKLPTKLLRYLS